VLAKTQPLAAFFLGFGTLLFVAMAIALFKGKRGTVLLGVAGVKFGGLVLWLVGATRLAKPESTWSKAFYAPRSVKLRRATARFSEAYRGPRPPLVPRRDHGLNDSPVYVYVDARAVHLHHAGFGNRASANAVVSEHIA
jgi:hypothetical protein